MVVRTPKKTLEEKMDAVIDDPVNHPSHYTDGIETIDYIESSEISEPCWEEKPGRDNHRSEEGGVVHQSLY